MPTKAQDAWTFSVLGFDVAAVAGAVKTIVQSLPGSAMLPDCKPVKGKVPGPAQHLLCATHGHVVDIKEKKIIAVSLDQYKSQKIGSAKPAPAATPAKNDPSAQSPAATSPNAPDAANAPAKTVAPPADTQAAKLRAEVQRLSSSMQSEVEDIAFIRSEHEKLAGGGRLNRAISWISDKAGGADDPGDELADIGTKILMEHMQGMLAMGKLDTDAAHKHLTAMQALNDKAHLLWQKYTGETIKGADRTVTGLGVVSKAGDVATMGLNVVAPGTGKALSILKNVSVTVSKMGFGEKVNWTEFTVDMAFDLISGKASGSEKVAEKLAGSFAKKLAPKLFDVIVKKWGVAAAAKRLGGKVTKEAIEKYILTEAEELIKSRAKDIVTPVAERVVEKVKDTDITHGELVQMAIDQMTDPSAPFSKILSDKLMVDFTP